MRIILGPASVQLGRQIAQDLNVEDISVAFKAFPDGENYIRLEGPVRGEDVVIVQTTSPPQDTRLIQLALMADAAKRNSAKKLQPSCPIWPTPVKTKLSLEASP